MVAAFRAIFRHWRASSNKAKILRPPSTLAMTAITAGNVATPGGVFPNFWLFFNHLAIGLRQALPLSPPPWPLLSIGTNGDPGSPQLVFSGDRNAGDRRAHLPMSLFPCPSLLFVFPWSDHNRLPVSRPLVQICLWPGPTSQVAQLAQEFDSGEST